MEQTVNSFQKGMLCDTHPMIQGNETLSDALNATYITSNGNEIILQNDMGNRKIEEAFLPVGYVPVGIKEYGGIIYIASYNPITNMGLIGSFPSPERTNIYNDDNLDIDFSFDTFEEKGFCFFKELDKIFVIYKDILHTGDKFTLFNTNELWVNKEEYKEYLSNFDNIDETSHKILSPKNKQYTLSVGILDLNNNFIDITKELYRYNVKFENGKATNVILAKNGNNLYDFNRGYFLAGKQEFEKEDIVQSYRDIVSTPGTLYKLKINSPLCIKVKHNYPSKFYYSISGQASSDKTIIESLTITATLEYNCPDGGTENEDDYDDIYYNYFTNGLSLLKLFDFKIIKDNKYVEVWSLTLDLINKTTPLLNAINKLNDLSKLEEVLNDLILKYPDNPSYPTFLSLLLNNELTPENIKSTLNYSLTLLYINIAYNIPDGSYPNISHETDSNGNIIYKASVTRQFTKFIEYQQYFDITYNRINSKGEHILDYFIGVPYSLVKPTNDCRENPYIRSLSTFGEINIDLLNSEIFRIIIWKFYTYLEGAEWKTTITYQFDTGYGIFLPFDIELTNVYPDTQDIIKKNIKGVSGSFTISNEELGEAYSVQFKRNGEILTNAKYWVICTELFNGKDLSSTSYVGNNYVEVDSKDYIIDNVTYNTLENQLKLLTVPLDVLLESTLEDEGVEVTLESATFDKDTIIESDSNEPPTGTLTLKYKGIFDIKILITQAKIEESKKNLYPKFINDFVERKGEDKDMKFNFNISNFNPGKPTLMAGDREKMLEDTSIPNNIYEFVDSEYRMEFNNTGLHIKGLVNFDYIYVFEYYRLEEYSTGKSRAITVLEYNESTYWETNNTGKLYSNYLNNLNSGKKYLAIKKSDNESYYIFNSEITTNNNLDSITGGPSKYTKNTTIHYSSDNIMYYVDNNQLVLVNYLKTNILEVIKLFKNNECNLLKTNFENPNGQVLYYNDGENHYNLSDVNILWMKANTKLNYTEEWVPIKYGNGDINNIIDRDINLILKLINTHYPGIPINQTPVLYIPTKIDFPKENEDGQKHYIYGKYSYKTSPNSIESPLQIIKNLSHSNYGVWMTISNNQFNLEEINIENIKDDKLEIFGFNIGSNSLKEDDLFKKFVAPIDEVDKYYGSVEKLSAPGSLDYYEVYDTNNNKITDGTLVNVEPLNLGTYMSTGCLLEVNGTINGKTSKYHFVLSTGLMFLDDNGNQITPIFNMNRINLNNKEKNKYMGINTTEGLRVGSNSTGSELDLSFKNNELITHLFSYDRQS